MPYGLRSRLLVAAIVPALALLVGCDGSTGPDEQLDLSGAWAYSASNLSGQFDDGTSIACQIDGITMNLTQSGSTFTGSTTVGSLECSAGGLTESGSVSLGPVQNGQLSGNQVSFEITTGSEVWSHSGTASANSMSGTVQVSIQLETQVVNLEGSWQASRSSSAAVASDRVTDRELAEGETATASEVLCRIYAC